MAASRREHTPRQATAQLMAVVWGVHAVVTPDVHSMTEAVSWAGRVAMTEGFAQRGDEIVVTAGVPFGHSGTTNALRVASVKSVRGLPRAGVLREHRLFAKGHLCSSPDYAPELTGMTQVTDLM